MNYITIVNYADIINCHLNLIYRHNANWICRFENCDVKQGSAILISEYGSGITPELAIRDYINKIKGKGIVLNASSKTLRREFVVPQNICYGYIKWASSRGITSVK